MEVSDGGISSATNRLERELVAAYMAETFHSHVVLSWQLRLRCPAAPSTATELTLQHRGTWYARVAAIEKERHVTLDQYLCCKM